jgi:hypothetical protein
MGAIVHDFQSAQDEERDSIFAVLTVGEMGEGVEVLNISTPPKS